MSRVALSCLELSCIVLCCLVLSYIVSSCLVLSCVFSCCLELSHIISRFLVLSPIVSCCLVLSPVVSCCLALTRVVLSRLVWCRVVLSYLMLSRVVPCCPVRGWRCSVCVPVRPSFSGQKSSSDVFRHGMIGFIVYPPRRCWVLWIRRLHDATTEHLVDNFQSRLKAVNS